MKTDYYNSPSKGRLSVEKLVSSVESFVADEPDKNYRLVIGTDSQVNRANGEVGYDFVTAIVIYRGGKGARYFWKKKKLKGKMVLRNRIYLETQMSLDVAQKLVPEVRKVISPTKYDLEIHIDVGPLGSTREMIREVVGMVRGNGFVAKTKPESWAASSVADKYA